LPQSDKPSRPDPSLPGGIPLFLYSLGSLALLRVILGYVSMPLAWLPPVNLVLAVLFLAVPILAMFFGANAHWTGLKAGAFVAGGLIVQFGIILVGNSVPMPAPVAGVLIAIAQAALACWCVGLGALLATLVKEKNIILPIAIFLAAYDFFLVLTPWGFTQTLLKVAQPVFKKVAAQIPAVTSAPTHGLAAPQAYVGMADLVFLAMFFIALFRFRMRTKATLYAVIPALVAYLLIVLFLGDVTLFGFSLSALPALVPIGLAVLLVNWAEFKLNRDEKISTVVLAVLAIGFLVFAATRPKPPPSPQRDSTQQREAGSQRSPVLER
jgi:hypothetical protein